MAGHTARWEDQVQYGVPQALKPRHCYFPGLGDCTLPTLPTCQALTLQALILVQPGPFLQATQPAKGDMTCEDISRQLWTDMPSASTPGWKVASLPAFLTSKVSLLFYQNTTRTATPMGRPHRNDDGTRRQLSLATGIVDRCESTTPTSIGPVMAYEASAREPHMGGAQT